MFFEKFTARFSASPPVVYKNPPPRGQKFIHHWCWEGGQVSVAIFPSSGGGV